MKTEIETEQLQIDDEVLYVHEHIRTKILGYVWKETFGALPTVVLYRLACGISVPREALTRGSELRRSYSTSPIKGGDNGGT